jgi:omega-amidase
MDVFALQYDTAWENRDANTATIRRLLGDAPEPGSLIVLPEMALTGFSMNVARIAETNARESEAAFAQLARDFKSWVLGGLVTTAENGRGQNEAVVVAPSGHIAARYAKMHPFSFTGENDHYVSGTEPVVAACDAFTLAPFVCYDLRFPEVFRTTTRRGANLIVVIANWLDKRHGHWRLLLRARAVENQSWVIGVNRTGSDPKHKYLGGSCIVAPDGKVIAEGGETEAVVRAVVDFGAVKAIRESFPVLKDLHSDWTRP